MRWLIGVTTVFALAWAVYIASPYWAVLDLASAIEADDPARIVRRVNLRAVRISVAKQVVAEALASRNAGTLTGSDTQANAGAIAVAADPLLEQVVTVEGLTSLLRRVRAQQAERNGSGTHDGGWFARALGFASASRWRGFRNVYFTVGSRPGTDTARLQLRLSRMQWRLVAVDLPDTERSRLLEEAIRLRALPG